jgi:uncharacterized protein
VIWQGLISSLSLTMLRCVLFFACCLGLLFGSDSCALKARGLEIGGVNVVGKSEQISTIHAAPSQRPRFVRDKLVINGASGGQHHLTVEVARSLDELAYGLMHITRLPDTEGMLFILPRAEPQNFWMKDTRLPLDLLFANAQGLIITIAADATPGSLHYIASQGAAKAVLEIPAGMAKRWGLKVGDRLRYKDFNP